VPHRFLSPIEDIIEDARNGRMFILVDDEDRENEGDLVIPAEMADDQAVNYMAKHGRGLICLALTSERAGDLGLQMMTRNNQSRHETAFTVSIESREGVTTGISAADRATTIATAINPSNDASDISTPGHVFPLVARNGGVLVRAGHTEAAVDIARIAGMNPSGVICEIMNDDGTMARLPDLVEIAKRLDLKVATIADLIAYRRRNDNLVNHSAETVFNSQYGGDFKSIVYDTQHENAEHLVLVKGDISGNDPVLVRMQRFNVFEDVLGDTGGGDSRLSAAMRAISDEGRGVVVLLREMRNATLADLLRKRRGQKTVESPALRDYGVGAQILHDLGVREMILLTNHKQRHIIGLDGYGLTVVGYREFSVEGDESEQES